MWNVTNLSMGCTSGPHKEPMFNFAGCFYYFDFFSFCGTAVLIIDYIFSIGKVWHLSIFLSEENKLLVQMYKNIMIEMIKVY